MSDLSTNGWKMVPSEIKQLNRCKRYMHRFRKLINKEVIYKLQLGNKSTLISLKRPFYNLKEKKKKQKLYVSAKLEKKMHDFIETVHQEAT